MKNEKVVKILDFGFAHKMDSKGNAIMLYKCGSRGYMAPEIVLSREDIDRGGEGIQITSAVDMWSFGIILYEMSVAYSPLRIIPNLITTVDDLVDQGLFK